MNITNLLITGEKGIGKSTLLQQVLEEIVDAKRAEGFYTLPYYEGAFRKGFYFHSIRNLEGNDKPISIQENSWSCIGVAETFETLGVKALQCALESEAPLIIMDEIGVLEQHAENFKNLVEDVLASSKLVIGVIKEKQHPFLKRIKERQDVKLYELTADTRTEVKALLMQDYKRIMEEAKK